MKNDYYVYEHRRKDNNDVFYIGKGRGRRGIVKTRNDHHDAVAKKYGMVTNIVKDNLTEQEAFDLEKQLIHHYVFDLGYSIDITGYRRKSKTHKLCNQTFGGEGLSGVVHSKEWRKKHSQDMQGDKNPMYGVNLWETFDDDKKRDVSQKLSKAFKGSKNPMYGISPEQRMDEETFKEWHKKVTERCKAQTGKKNPNYGNKTLHNKLEANPELRKQYYSRKGTQNGRCRAIDLLSLDGTFIKHFEYIGECAGYVKEKAHAKGTLDSIRSNITIYSKKDKPYLGFRYKLY